MSGSPPGSYGQLIPSHHNPVIVHDGMHSSVPPVLPPHLLHVILNKEVVDHNDPSLLPEPDHVSLNHLYALSIKVSTCTTFVMIDNVKVFRTKSKSFGFVHGQPHQVCCKLK